MAKDLKNTIKNAYESETPDLRENIICACQNQTQASDFSSEQPAVAIAKKQPYLFRWIAAVASCLILFAVGLLIGRILPKSNPVAIAETCVYIDVNPSLELSLDEDNTVLTCTAANADAEIILNGMTLEGVKLKTALNAIVGSMYVNGYLTSDDNSMLISVDTNDTSNTSVFLSYITNQVNEVFANSEMECAIIAQGVKVDDDLKRRAEEQGVSVGKMHLLDKMVGSVNDLDENDIPELARMSIKDLNLIYSSKPEEDNKPKDEIISGSVPVGITADEALNAVLKEIGKTIDGVEEHHIFFLPSKLGESKTVYAVTLKFYGDNKIYKYEVDCHTKEVTKAQADIPPNSNNPNVNGDMNNGDMNIMFP
ncbi:MAG: PepSY domain-containing protein [Candidatus Coproplasma sp.]